MKTAHLHSLDMEMVNMSLKRENTLVFLIKLLDTPALFHRFRTRNKYMNPKRPALSRFLFCDLLKQGFWGSMKLSGIFVLGFTALALLPAAPCYADSAKPVNREA